MAETKHKHESDEKQSIMPRWVVYVPVFYLLLITLLAIIRNQFGSVLPDYLIHPFGQMPLSVPWFGALGAITASLHGIFLHNRDWKHSYDYWYMLNVPVGAIFGVFTYLFLIVIVQAATDKVDMQSTLVFPLAAFIMGYSQRDFLRLLRRASSVIFGSNNKN